VAVGIVVLTISKRRTVEFTRGKTAMQATTLKTKNVAVLTSRAMNCSACLNIMKTLNKEQLLQQIEQLDQTIAQKQAEKKELKIQLKPFLDEERAIRKEERRKQREANRPLNYKEYKAKNGLYDLTEARDFLWDSDLNISIFDMQHEIKTGRLKAQRYKNRWLISKENLELFVAEQGQYFKET
jgi:regulator of replication initiation timing